MPTELVNKNASEVISKYGPGKVLIVVGETGSGKSTGIPRALLAETADTIIVTQPRRVAAISLCSYVKKITENEDTDMIGYKVRFKDTTTRKTRLHYVTDGILLKMMEENRKSTKTTTIILDEVHERSIRTDILLGLLKKKIDSIRLILMSATADTKMLREYFAKDGIPVEYCEIPGKKYPVSIKYMPRRSSDYIQLACDTIKKIIKETRKANEAGTREDGKKEKENVKIEMDEVDEIFGNNCKTNRKYTAVKNNKSNSNGNSDISKLENNSSMKNSVSEDFSAGTVLVFLSGLEDIDDLYRMLEIHSSIELLKLHSSLPDAEQRLIFSRRTKPIRVILSTNIAETSITISDVKWVIDSGVQKVNITKDGIDTLGIVKISKSSAKQRAGRAGRVGPGVCYRLYTESAYLSMEENNIPEIIRSDISSVSLSLINMKIDPRSFDFLESPGANSISSSLSELFILGLIDKDGEITELGKKVSALPVSPCQGKFLLVAKSMGAGCSAAAVCSLLSGERISLFSKDANISSIESVHKSQSKGSDLTLYASLFFTYISYEPRLRGDFCRSLGISPQEIKTSERIYFQLLQLLKEKHEIKNETEEADEKTNYIPLKQKTADRLHAAASAGFLTKVASSHGNGAYLHMYTGKNIFIHPSSIMFKRREETISFIMTSETTKPYILHTFPYTGESILPI
ncbi:ATP-dependent RNA helicase DHX36 [Nematocida minor]|uniref:ATP-dependent RNA helicase DHX36 n=1 Tax=Nematocida minor TaxID=1912983 RepID=UPI00221E997C|nr:ATP-dependent RNA helicase DHX36 [Nematocida minor]KAI5190543.1 ATP-dependent RNA helicase DHX36 [Nematocida minor]